MLRHATETRATSMRVVVRWITTYLPHVVCMSTASTACISQTVKTIGLFVFSRMVTWKRSPVLVIHGATVAMALSRRRQRYLLELASLEIRRATSISQMVTRTAYAQCRRMEPFGHWPASTLACLASPSTDAPCVRVILHIRDILPIGKKIIRCTSLKAVA